MGDIGTQSVLDLLRSRAAKSKLKARKTSTTRKNLSGEETELEKLVVVFNNIKCLKQIPKLDVKFLCVCFRTWATLHKSFCIKRDSIHLDIKSG